MMIMMIMIIMIIITMVTTTTIIIITITKQSTRHLHSTQQRPHVITQRLYHLTLPRRHPQQPVVRAHAPPNRRLRPHQRLHRRAHVIACGGKHARGRQRGEKLHHKRGEKSDRRPGGHVLCGFHDETPTDERERRTIGGKHRRFKGGDPHLDERGGDGGKMGVEGDQQCMSLRRRKQQRDEERREVVLEWRRRFGLTAFSVKGRLSSNRSRRRGAERRFASWRRRRGFRKEGEQGGGCWRRRETVASVASGLSCARGVTKWRREATRSRQAGKKSVGRKSVSSVSAANNAGRK